MNRQAQFGFFRLNGLSLVLLVLFLAFWVGQLLTGSRASNQERIEQGVAPEAMAV